MADELQVPRELKGKLPQMIVEMAMRSVLVILLVAMVPALLYGQSVYHQAWEYFAPAIGGPLLAGIFLLLRPFNPYQSYYARLEEIDKDFFPVGSPEAKLIQMLRSEPAKRLVLKSCAVTAAILLTLVSIIASLKPSPIKTSFNLWNNIFIALMYAIITFGVCCHVLLRWAFKNWNAR